MARKVKRSRRKVNPFDVLIVLLVLCLAATFAYRIYQGVAHKDDRNTSSYVLTFTCNGEVSSMTDYLKSGTPVYLSANGELLGYIYGDEFKVEEITEPAADGTETGEVATENSKPLPYNNVNIEGKIILSSDLEVYSNGVYYSIGDINFAQGSKLTLYTEEASFTVTVKNITLVD